jgi:hypothetical protein
LSTRPEAALAAQRPLLHEQRDLLRARRSQGREDVRARGQVGHVQDAPAHTARILSEAGVARPVVQPNYRASVKLQRAGIAGSPQSGASCTCHRRHGAQADAPTT